MQLKPNYYGNGEGNGNLLWYSCLENPHGQRSLAGYSPQGAKSWTRLKRLNFAACIPAQKYLLYCKHQINKKEHFFSTQLESGICLWVSWVEERSGIIVTGQGPGVS